MDDGFKRLLKRSRFLVGCACLAHSTAQRWRRLTGPFGRSRAIASYLRQHEVRKLQIGAGANELPGWLNTDGYPVSHKITFLDATRRFPFADNVFDYIHSEHQIEHLTYPEGRFMLRECHRVLRPGGRIRIATPDLEVLIGLYAPEKNRLQKRYIQWIIDRYLPETGEYRESFVINNAFHNWGHRFIYDRMTLHYSMEQAGFVGISYFGPGESDDDNLRGIESHGLSVGDDETSNFETMVLEAHRRV